MTTTLMHNPKRVEINWPPNTVLSRHGLSLMQEISTVDLADDKEIERILYALSCGAEVRID